MSNTQSDGGSGFLVLLTIVFITLKLTGYISWSWWWVLAPMWVPLALVLGFMGVVALLSIIVAFVTRNR